MSEDGRSVQDLLVARLRSLGVTRTYGLALDGLDCVRTDDPDLAVLLADADGRLGARDGSGRLGAATLAGPILHLSSAPGGRAPLQTVGSAEELLDALVDPPGLTVPGTLALHLDLDLDTPVPDGLVPSVAPERSAVLTLDPSLASLRLLVVVGPGVVRAGALDGLRTAARAAVAPVLATWGAIGVERWDSPFHAGVGGLQAGDLALGGLDGADVVITSGLDPDELPPSRLAAPGGPGRATGPTRGAVPHLGHAHVDGTGPRPPVGPRRPGPGADALVGVRCGPAHRGPCGAAPVRRPARGWCRGR